MKQDFPLADILMATTGRCLSTDDLSSLQRLLSYMTRDDIYTHQIPRAVHACKHWILQQHPELEDVAFTCNKRDWREWLATQVARFGASLPIEPLPGDDWTYVNPIVEAEQMFGAERVIVVVAGEE